MKKKTYKITTNTKALTHKLEVIYHDPKTLIPSSLNIKLFGDPVLSEIYITLKQSIALCGILQPLTIDFRRNIISGNLRLQCALELGLTEVPTIQIENSTELNKLNTTLQDNRELYENYITLIHNIKQKDSVAFKIIAMETFKEVYKIVQGCRTDKNPVQAEAAKVISSIMSKATRTKAANIRKKLEKAFPNNRAKQNEWLNGQGAKTSIKTVYARAKKLAATTPTNNATANEIDPDKKYDYVKNNINIYNQSCSDLSRLGLRSIQSFITSCPYYGVPTPNSNINDPEIIGNEKKVDEFADRLANIFLNCIPYLTEDGSIFVIISDVVRNGSYQLGPEALMLKMKERGFKIPMKFFWLKSNAQPGDGQNTFENVEYILRFSVCAEPYTNYEWLNETDAFEGNTFGNGETIKLSSYINLKKGFITTSGANTLKLREACERTGGFYLDHNTTQPVEIPYALIKLSAKKGSIICDLFNGCGTTAKAVLQCEELDLTYYGFEIMPLYVRASEINLEIPNKTIPLNPNHETQKAA